MHLDERSYEIRCEQLPLSSTERRLYWAERLTLSRLRNRKFVADNYIKYVEVIRYFSGTCGDSFETIEAVTARLNSSNERLYFITPRGRFQLSRGAVIDNIVEEKSRDIQILGLRLQRIERRQNNLREFIELLQQKT